MLFRTVYILLGVSLNEGEEFESSADSPFYITLRIRRSLEGEEPNLSKEDCLCVVQTKEDVPEDVRPLFDNIKEWQPGLHDIVEPIANRLDEYMRNTANVLRWRRGKTGHANTIHSSRELEWSVDGQNWKHVPRPRIIGLVVVPGIPWSRLNAEVGESVANLLTNGVSEPLAHELFHEAWSLRTDNPRSSLLIGIAAAEVGIKSLIGFLVPQAEWLAFNLPSPPIIDILTKYLPSLPTKLTFGAAPFIPKNVRKVLQDAVAYRNQITHAGKTKDPVSPDTLKNILIAVRELLYILDVYSGHEWALGNLSQLTRESIKTEVQKQKEKARSSSES